MTSIRSIQKAIQRRTTPVKKARDEIKECNAAWVAMMARMDDVIGWVRKNCTREQIAIYETWAKVDGKLTDAERVVFRSISPPTELTEQARKAMQVFDGYPKHIKAAVVAARKAFNAL